MSQSEASQVAEPMDKALLALSRYRRRRFDDAIDLSSVILAQNFKDQVSIYVYFR